MTAVHADPDRLYWDEHVREGIEAREQRDGAQWRLGDLAASVETTYGEQSLQRYAEDIGVAFNTLQEYRRVALAFGKSTRVDIPWSHHREVAAIDDPEPWLRMSAHEGWSVARLRDEIAKTRDEASAVAPVLSFPEPEDEPEPFEPEHGWAPAPVVEPPPSRLEPLMTSATPEWYTPPDIVDRVRQTLGAIDLDPCADAGKSIPAHAHFTEADDGLAQEWTGRVYMNPPYGDVIDQWVRKLRAEHEAGNVTAAVALVPGRIDTRWFEVLADFPMCAVRGRLKFSGHDNSAPFPSVLFYLGDDEAAFVRAFRDLGRIWRALP